VIKGAGRQRPGNPAGMPGAAWRFPGCGDFTIVAPNLSASADL
jgi:hypothetical protein